MFFFVLHIVISPLRFLFFLKTCSFRATPLSLVCGDRAALSFVSPKKIAYVLPELFPSDQISDPRIFSPQKKSPEVRSFTPVGFDARFPWPSSTFSLQGISSKPVPLPFRHVVPSSNTFYPLDRRAHLAASSWSLFRRSIRRYFFRPALTR